MLEMFTIDTVDKAITIANHYGYEAQSRQCMEECAELIQAINKHWRNVLQCGNSRISERTDCKEKNDIEEELADVQIMLWQISYLLDCPYGLTVEKKLNRQLKRIEEEGAIV